MTRKLLAWVLAGISIAIAIPVLAMGYVAEVLGDMSDDLARDDQ